MRFLYTLFACLCIACGLQAQTYHAPLHSQSEYLYERLSVLNGADKHFSVHPFSRKDIANFALENGSEINGRNAKDIQYLLNDNNDFVPFAKDSSEVGAVLGYEMRKKPVLKHFFKTPAHAFEFNSKAFKVKINPMIQANFGTESDDENLLFLNQRGIELRGGIDNKVWFYSNILESQGRFPTYVRDYLSEYKAIPTAGFYKTFKSRVADIEDANDYNVAEAYIGFQATKHIGVQFGHGRQFIGNGIRSMFLSDFSNLNYYLKLNTRVWKLHYQNLFMELTPTSKLNNPVGPGDGLLPKKYIAIHYLSYKPRKNLQFGFFETTVFNRSERFEFQYLNPVILYRSVEGMLGSPDNSLIGVDGRWDIKKRVSLYSQFLLDEFKFSELIAPETPGWWANKYSIQLGAKYFNVFNIDHLDMQIEYNSSRPYTYSHRDPYNSFTHYGMPLAHPLGANFREMLARVRYQPTPRLNIEANLMSYTRGDDALDVNGENINWGGNPLLTYNTRVMNYNNEIGQGVENQVTMLGFRASYHFFYNTFLDAGASFRNFESSNATLDRNDVFLNFGIRMNVWDSPQKAF